MIELRRRNSAKSAPSGRLPKGYQEVEYLESTGTQYIDTKLSLPDGFLFESYITSIGSGVNSIYGIFGSHEPISPFKRNTLYYTTIRDYGYVIGCGENYYNGMTIKYGVRTKIEASTLKSNSYLIVDDLRVAGSDVNNSERSARNLYLFAINNVEENKASQFFIGRIESTKIYNADKESVRHLIPCYRTSDRIAGMYDIVNDVFYVNQGTGEFLVGPDVGVNTILPPEYQQVEYLESTGTQYIILPYYYVPTTDTISFKLNFAKLANWGTPLGYYGSRVSGDAQLFRLQNQEGNLWASYGSLAGNAETGLTLSSIGVQYASFDAGKGFCLNGEYYGLYGKYIIGNETNTPILFGYRIIGDISTSGEIRKSSAIIYSYAHNRDNTCLLDLIPCYRREDNVAGMYDLVEGKLHTNQGTGEFIVGPDVIG